MVTSLSTSPILYTSKYVCKGVTIHVLCDYLIQYAFLIFYLKNIDNTVNILILINIVLVNNCLP